MMKNQLVAFLLLVGAWTLAACSDSSPADGGNDSGSTRQQTFYVVAESVGELFANADDGLDVQTRRPISSVSPTQTFDRMDLIIMENKVPAKVVFRKTLDGWSNLENRVSVPWSTEDGQGRYATIRLEGDECLTEGESYLVYAIGYQTGTYGNYEPFRQVEAGDAFDRTEVATVPAGGSADEIFAGAEIFFVKDGRLLSQRNNAAEPEPALVIARRQVAGTFGYFTRIPVSVSGKKVARLRLVTLRENRSVIFGGFRSMEDAVDFGKGNVINGMNPRTDCDARFAGSVADDAFKVYDIDLCKWFPGNVEDAELPLDADGDGYLDEGDTNWQIDGDAYPAGTISLAPGTVFADRFLIAAAISQEDVEKGLPTFQMQLLDAGGQVLKSWNVLQRTVEEESEQRTIVSLPEGENGRTQISLVDNIDTDICFSLVRNRLYTMGEKGQAQSYGEDEPIDLSRATNLVMDAYHEWHNFTSIFF